MRAIREAVAGLRRAPLLGGLSVLTIGFSLFILGLFGLTAHNIERAISDVEAQVEVVGYLEETAGAERGDIARREIASYPEVASVRYVSKVEALHYASQELTEFSEVFSELEVNPLPASLQVRLKPEYRDEEHVRAVADRLAGYDFVEEVRYGQEWVEQIFYLRRVGAVAAIALGGAFALVALMLIGTAIRMAILARSEEIAIMQTVGATEGYIRRPFLLEGLFTGLAGGVLALVLTRVAYLVIDGSFLALAWLPDTWVLAGLAAGALFGMLAAARAVRKELRGVYDF